MTEWIFRGTQFAEGAVLPDGMQPVLLIEKWEPWVTEGIDLLDADGAFRNYPCPGSLREQPAYDMEVLRAVRAQWVALMNEKVKGSNGR